MVTGWVGGTEAILGSGAAVVLLAGATLGTAAGMVLTVGSGKKPGGAGLLMGCSSGTLGSEARAVSGQTLMVGGTGTRLALVQLAKMVASWVRTDCFSVLSGARGEAGDRFHKALVRSRPMAMAALTEDSVGMMVLVGNQARVLQIRLALVSLRCW